MVPLENWLSDDVLTRIAAENNLAETTYFTTAPGIYVDFVSRCFFPNAGIDEDPVIGSAPTVITPYWAQKLQKEQLTARKISRRGGVLIYTIKKDGILLDGQAVTYLEGQFKI